MFPLVNDSAVPAPLLYQDEAFGFAVVVTPDLGEAYTFAGKARTLVLDKKGGSRITIPTTDAGWVVSPDGLTLTFTKPATWTKANLTPGNWQVNLFCAETHILMSEITVTNPRNGAL
jgi:hypothetical protein